MGNMTEYVELHARSAFSFLEGAALPEEYAVRAAELEMPAMALLDTGGVYGSPRFHMAAKKAGIRAHIGAEIPSTEGCRYPLIARTRLGYQNLCRLITRMKLRAAKGEGAATPEEIAEFSPGLICLTGGEDGPLAAALRTNSAKQKLELLLGTFGKENVFAELHRHRERSGEARNQAVAGLARSFRVPLLATNGVCHARPEQRRLMDALTSIRFKTTLNEAGRLLARNEERHLKSSAEMAHLFSDIPEAVSNTVALSGSIEFTLSDLGYEFPRFPVPEGETMMSVLRERAVEGARRRYRPFHERARRQIDRELNLIERLNLPGYFLIVWDIVEYCRANGILVQGRGSAANSAVCYSLGITAVDPVGMDLLFERFLSEERGEWPDIDLDLPSGDKRERVIQHVYTKYGRHGAAMTANVITYRGRSAAREVGKVLGFDIETTGRLSALVRHYEWKDPSDTAAKKFREAGLDMGDARIRHYYDLFNQIQDLPRHLGQHSGGMVICQGSLDAVVPLEPASMPGRVVVQWDKEDCADMGIIKVDLLGLGMMAVIEESLILIPNHYDGPVDLAHLPQDDPAVYAALQKADTVGMFQVESRAQMATLPRMMPKTFYDLVVEVALIRPGPIVGNMVHPYLRRRAGLEPTTCLHESLEPVLRRTLGLPLFQEQLLRMAMIAADFTGGEAEELRRAMGFKRSEARMAEIEKKLRRGMTAKGITGETQETIINSITSFALYGFPESHAASFALLAYASAYLKCHYLAAFTVAILNNQPMGFYHPSTLVKDAQRHGLRVLPTDVIESEWKCTVVERNTMRLGFNYVRGMRESTAQAIVAARRERPFASIDEVARRVPELRKDELRRLAEVGALNNLGKQHRRDALWHAEAALRPAGPLIDPASDAGGASPLQPMSVEERLRADYNGTGINIGCHPMKHLRPRIAAKGVIRAGELAAMRDGALVRVAGSVIVRQRPGTAKGFFFMSMEDETGIANIICAPDVFERNKPVLLTRSFMLIEGVLQNQMGVVSVKAHRVSPLEAAADIPVESHDFH
jgi:error-prone DNA polymerase